MLDYLESSHFRAFLEAATTLNFTSAAKRAHMTQSGISQHIAKLEEQLETPLFKRVNKKVFLTEAGERLRRFIEKHSDETLLLIEGIKGEVAQASGLVKYAMPHSCLFTPHFPLLLKKREGFSKINLEVKLVSNEEVFDQLLKQEIDFGFVTTKSENPAIEHHPFAAEEYILIGNSREQLKKITKANIRDFNFVDYPGMNVLFNLWAENQLQTRKASHDLLNIAGSINSLSGAITMVARGVGLTVIPKHCVLNEIKSKSIFEYEGQKRDGLLNEIYIVTLREVFHPRRVQTVLEAFWQMRKVAP